MSYKLFEVFGVELEYMIVDRQSHKIRPIADQIFMETTGTYTSDYDNGDIAWSNELVSHVVELKTNGPVKSMEAVLNGFHQNIREINKILEKHQAILMPGGAHPTVDPLTETQIWPHEHNEIYELYNRIFNCKGHGWSNLQSTHINLPFQGDEEFKRLHSAIRALLPIIPALSASTPILDGKLTGFKDTRLEYYRKNQAKIPIIAGLVIPESVYSHADYHSQIFVPIQDAIRPFDTHGILDHHFLNSRGAIARFDRGAIEIRIIDNQEAPKVDIALLCLFVEVLKDLCQLEGQDAIRLQSLKTDALAKQFLAVIQHGEKAQIEYPELAEIFGFSNSAGSLVELWEQLYARYKSTLSGAIQETIEFILKEGSLATRMEKVFGKHPDLEGIRAINQQMIDCLDNNIMFKG
ncbi:MAG: carboxylate-amine ligase [Luteibaculum sp.]